MMNTFADIPISGSVWFHSNGQAFPWNLWRVTELLRGWDAGWECWPTPNACRERVAWSYQITNDSAEHLALCGRAQDSHCFNRGT